MHGAKSCAFALLLLAGCSKGGEPDAKARSRPPPLVTVARVEARDVPVELRATVDLRPIAQADVGSKTVGYLDAVLVDRGDRVKKGQLLAIVRPSDLPDQLAVARGGLAQVQASAALARSNFERVKLLAPSGVVSQQDLQSATAAMASAEASEAASRAQIAALAVRLGETRIEAPLDGFVLSRKLDPGALVGTPNGGPILAVARVDVLRVFVTVHERDASVVALGQPARIEVDAVPGKAFPGKVVRIAPAFDPTTRTLDAEVQLPNEAGELRPGMYGHAFVLVATHRAAPVVDVGAVQIAMDERYVFVLKGDKVQRRVVKTGVDGGTWFEVTQSLAAGEEVVVAGTDGLYDGAQVRVSRGEKQASGAPAVSAPTNKGP